MATDQNQLLAILASKLGQELFDQYPGFMDKTEPDSEDEDEELLTAAMATLLSTGLGDKEMQRLLSKKSRQVHKKMDNFVSDIIPAMTDQKFQEHFRLTRKTYDALKDILCQAVATKKYFPYEDVPENKNNANDPVRLEKALLITLWYAGNLSSMRQVANTFGVVKSTVHVCVKKICYLLTELSSQFIAWPDAAEMDRIEAGFRSKASFPGVVAAVDGSHIPIVCKNKEQQKAYCNRKGFHSVILQGACDNRKLFLNIYTGWPGSCHDARVFRNSELGHALLGTSAPIVPTGKHVLGDSAYPLTESLLTPYKTVGTLTTVQKKYNKHHSSTRIAVEHSYGLLKGRWRKLQLVDTELSFIPYLITACCVLHNVCQIHEDGFQDWFDEQKHRMTPVAAAGLGAVAVAGLGPQPATNSPAAKQKRDAIAQML